MTDETNDKNVVQLDAVRILSEAIRLKKDEIAMAATSPSLAEDQRAAKLSKLNGDLARLAQSHNTASKRVVKEAETEAKAEAKADAKAKADRAKEESGAYSDECAAAWLEFLKHNDYHYVQKANKYVLRMPDGARETVSPASLWERHSEFFDDADKAMFKTVMEERGRMYTTATMTFGDVAPWELNLISTEHWVKPTSGDYHVLFDILIQSLGGGKRENIEHLEKVLVWKYHSPHDWMLPTPIIFGEGEVGKGLFFEEVLPTLVGKHQVGVVEVDNALGNFTGLAVGKTFLLINEAVRDNVSMEKFKAKTAAKSVVVNEKYGLQYIAASTDLKFCGGNGITAAIALANDKSDRRWSIIRIEPGHSLMHWIMESQGFNTEQEASQWFQRERHHLSKPEHVSHWLDALIKKWEMEPYRPAPLHGADYRWLLDQQKRPWQELIEHVFNDPKFTHIHAPLLYRMYVWYHREIQPSSRFMLRKGDFYIHVDDYCRKQQNGIERRACSVKIGHQKFSNLDFYTDELTSTVANNNADYEIRDEYHKIAGFNIPGETMPTTAE